MLDTMAIVLASNNEADLGELTRVRTASAVPFGGRYRLVDFVLSNIVNSGINNVGVATDHKYQSLLNHLGNGKPWDLARKKEGLLLIPPYSKDADLTGDSRIDVLSSAIGFLERHKQRYVVVCDATNVCNIQFDEIVELHRQRNADITVAYQEVCCKKPTDSYICVDEAEKINDVIFAKDTRACNNRIVGYYVFTKDRLIRILEACMLHGYNHFIKDVILRNLDKLNIYGHKITTPLRSIYSVQDFYDVSMELFDEGFRNSLFSGESKIRTKSKDRIPARYLQNSKIKNSVVADGSIIDGSVEHSIISRGVHIAKGAIIKDCIIMPDCRIEANVHLECCILDKGCVITSGKTLVGQKDFPIVVGKTRVI